MNPNMYKVIIRCFTYNQSAFIVDALDGFTKQKTEFPFLIAVVDDASTDGEQDVIGNYISENFNLDYSKDVEYANVSYARHKDNLNCHIVFLALKTNHYKNGMSYKKAEYLKEWTDKSEYVAFCEGDDYWTDELKLQTQVKFLDNHHEYTACFHNAMIKWEGQNRPDEIMCNFETGDFNTTQIFEKWQLPLASLLVRKEVVLLKGYNKIRGGFRFFIVASLMGKVYGFSDCWSVYRKNKGGVSNSMSYSFCSFCNAEYAVESGVIDVLDVVLKKQKVGPMFYARIKGDAYAKKYFSLVKKHRPFFLFKEFIRFVLVWLPMMVIKKLFKKVL